MLRNRILVIDDEEQMIRILDARLSAAGFEVLSASNGEEGLLKVEEEKPDLILLDVMMPGMDGFEFCKRIKCNVDLENIPVIMLTARSDAIDKVAGLELGVDDYITKPFVGKELILRIKAVLSRVYQDDSSKNILGSGDLIVNTEKHSVTVQGEEVELTALEFKLLTALLNKKGSVLTREEMLRTVWGVSSDISTRRIDAHIKCLRNKINKAAVIETVRGFGYRIKS